MTRLHEVETSRPDDSYQYLSSREVIEHFNWKKSHGYKRLRLPGFPASLGGNYRLDTIRAWEGRVLRGELPGCWRRLKDFPDLAGPTDASAVAAALELPPLGDPSGVPRPERGQHLLTGVAGVHHEGHLGHHRQGCVDVIGLCIEDRVELSEFRQHLRVLPEEVHTGLK